MKLSAILPFATAASLAWTATASLRGSDNSNISIERDPSIGNVDPEFSVRKLELDSRDYDSVCDPLLEYFNLQCYRPEKKDNNEDLCMTHEAAYKASESLFQSCGKLDKWFGLTCYREFYADRQSSCSNIIQKYESTLPQYGEECNDIPGCGADMNCKFISDADGFRCLERKGLNPDGGYCRWNRQCMERTDCKDFRCGGATPGPTPEPTPSIEDLDSPPVIPLPEATSDLCYCGGDDAPKKSFFHGTSAEDFRQAIEDYIANPNGSDWGKNITCWDVNQVKSMKQAFYVAGRGTFNEPLSCWDS